MGIFDIPVLPLALHARRSSSWSLRAQYSLFKGQSAFQGTLWFVQLDIPGETTVGIEGETMLPYIPALNTGPNSETSVNERVVNRWNFCSVSTFRLENNKQVLIIRIPVDMTRNCFHEVVFVFLHNVFIQFNGYLTVQRNSPYTLVAHCGGMRKPTRPRLNYYTFTSGPKTEWCPENKNFSKFSRVKPYAVDEEPKSDCHEQN